MNPKVLLFVLIGVVPLIVLVAGVASILLFRAGYGFWMWGVLPFAGSLFLVTAISAVLGRAASGRRTSSRGGEDGEKDTE